MGSEKRKVERLEGRFEVAVREKLATWVTLTEDVSERGCRIELKRPLTPGALIQVLFDMGPGEEPLVAHAQVVWARRSPPHSAGIAFLTVPRQPKDTAARAGDWIDRLLGARVRRIAGMTDAAASVAASPPVPALTPPPALTPAPTLTPPPEPGSPAVVARVRSVSIIVPPAG